MKVSSGKKVVVHRGGTIKKGRLINVTRCRVVGSDVSVARSANLHQATYDCVCVCHGEAWHVSIQCDFCAIYLLKK